jgi:hypothetical protein
MEIEKFVDIRFIKHNDIIILEFTVNHAEPTPLQWIFAINETKKYLDELKQLGIKFGFLFNIQKMGLVSINYMKEFTELMSSNGPLLEKYLYATSAIAQGTLLKNFFGIINTFYKTKKPLKIVDNEKEAFEFIEQNVF